MKCIEIDWFYFYTFIAVRLLVVFTAHSFILMCDVLLSIVACCIRFRSTHNSHCSQHTKQFFHLQDILCHLPLICKQTLYVKTFHVMSLGMEEIQVIELGMMDKRKYYPLTFSSALCMRSFLYPFLLIKTRLQIQAGSQIYRGTFDAFYKIWLREGLSGFYRGYWFSCLQLFPSFVYISSYESVRDCLQHRSAGFAGSRPMLSFVSGGVASVVGQTMAVPIDVVTQHLMLMGQRGSVRGCEGDCRADPRLGSLQPIHTFGQTRRSRFGGVAAVMMEVYRRYGVMGFYKGFFVSLMCFAPNSALWWWFYDIYTGTSCR